MPQVIDLKKLRKDPEAYWKSLRGKQKKLSRKDFDRLVALDKDYLHTQRLAEDLRAEKRRVERQIKAMKWLEKKHEKRRGEALREVEDDDREREEGSGDTP